MIGDELKQLRRARGLTLRQVAERSGVTESILSKTENGKRDPAVSTVERVAGALGARVVLLLNEANEPMAGVPQGLAIFPSEPSGPEDEAG